MSDIPLLDPDDERYRTVDLFNGYTIREDGLMRDRYGRSVSYGFEHSERARFRLQRELDQAMPLLRHIQASIPERELMELVASFNEAGEAAE